MKTFKKIISMLSMVAVMFCATSCLDDEPLIDWDDMGVVIELPYRSHDLSTQRVVPGDDVSFTIEVNYTIDYASKVKNDIPVSLKVDDSMVDKYNATLPASAVKYEILPAGTYNLPSEIVIKKGTQIASADMAVNTTNLVPGKRYILPVVISDVPEGYTISGNFGHVYLRILMK